MALNLPLPKIAEGEPQLFKRITAFLIDLAILNFIVFIPMQNYVAGLVPTRRFSEQLAFFSSASHLSSQLFMISLAMATLAVVYFAVLEQRFGQSIGKMIMQLHVVSDSKELKSWQSVLRSLFILPFFPFIALWIIDPVTIFFSKNQKRLSEILSRTRVVQYYRY